VHRNAECDSHCDTTCAWVSNLGPTLACQGLNGRLPSPSLVCGSARGLAPGGARRARPRSTCGSQFARRARARDTCAAWTRFARDERRGSQRTANWGSESRFGEGVDNTVIQSRSMAVARHTQCTNDKTSKQE